MASLVQMDVKGCSCGNVNQDVKIFVCQKIEAMKFCTGTLNFWDCHPVLIECWWGIYNYDNKQWSRTTVLLVATSHGDGNTWTILFMNLVALGRSLFWALALIRQPLFRVRVHFEDDFLFSPVTGIGQWLKYWSKFNVWSSITCPLYSAPFLVFRFMHTIGEQSNADA